MSAVSDLMANLPARSLVLGDPDGLDELIGSLSAWADVLTSAARGLGRIETDWDGQAAADFKARYAVQPEHWKAAARAFDDATGALTAYRSVLIDAQYRAERARRLFQAGIAAAEATEASAGPGFAAVPPYQGNVGQSFDPTGAADRARAITMLQDARADLRAAGDRAADALVAAQAAAPQARHWWDAASDFQQQVRAWTYVQEIAATQWTYNNVVVPIVNGLANWGYAAVHNPAALGEMFAGAFMMASGIAGEGTGAVLDATGVGLPVGVPLNIASATAITAGGTLIVGGASTITQAAAETNMTVLQMGRSRAELERDPGFGGTPVRSANAGPVTEPGASPYQDAFAKRVEPYGGQGDKTSGLLTSSDGTARELLSGRREFVTEITKPRPGRNGVTITHVESQVGAIMKRESLDNATLYINRLPCSQSRGCSTLLPNMIPKGSTLTIFGPNNFVRVVHGIGEWL